MILQADKRNLIISAYKDANYSGEPEMVYTVTVNPKSIVRKNNIIFKETQAGGTSGTDTKFSHIKPERFSFSFVIDGTGVDGEEKEADWTVEKEIEEFRKISSYEGSEHQPLPLKLIWGALEFNGVIANYTITYTLFDEKADPLRARVEALFVEKITDEMRDKRDKPSSPDLTHVRVVQEGDTLPLMAHRIYGDPRYYLSVARANGLDHYRDLKPGQKIYFPPLK